MTAAGGEVVDSAGEADTLVMTGGPDALAQLDHPGIRVVQLPSAGVEGWFAAGVLREGITYVSATGAYAPACAEHALALMLALARRLDEYAGARQLAARRRDHAVRRPRVRRRRRRHRHGTDPADGALSASRSTR